MKEDINILVVDDEQVVINSCKRVLGEEGYNVQSALSGREAMSLMQNDGFNLAFVDLKMPEMDGIALIGWIKKFKPDTEVGVITGYPSQDTIEEAINLGCFDYVPKPFNPAILTDVTHRAVELIKRKTPDSETAVEDFTPEMAARLDEMIEPYKNIPGNLIPVLQKAQGLVGYLPPVVQRHISKRLKIPAAEVHSVVSFYSFFTMKPRGKHLIRLCLGTACYVKKVETILEKFKSELHIDVEEVTSDKMFSLETVRCLGACGLAPVVMVDEDTYGAMKPKKVTEVLSAYK